MSSLKAWLNGKRPWVSDALQRAALSGEATVEIAHEIALRVQADNGIASAGRLECLSFDIAAIKHTLTPEKVPLLGSIGPLNNVDRLLPNQQLKFGLSGVTIIYGENGSGKSGYARAARRLCTSRVPVVLQTNVFTQEDHSPSVTFTLKTGEEDPVTYTWIEGTELPNTCQHMSFLDTANAATYIEDKTEILFLPPEVQVITILAQLYTLAGKQCQSEVERLNKEHSIPLPAQFTATTTAGQLVEKLNAKTPLLELPTIEQLEEAAQWNSNSETELYELRQQHAIGPGAQAITLKRLAKTMKDVADKATEPLVELDQVHVQNDIAIHSKFRQAQVAAETFAREKASNFPISLTGEPTWKKLFLIARQFAAEADLVPGDAAFAEGDLCVLCQQPLDLSAAQRMNEFDIFISNEIAKAETDAKKILDDRIQRLSDLNIPSAEYVLQTLSEHRSKEGLRCIIESSAQFFQDLISYRDQQISYLKDNSLPGKRPDISRLDALHQAVAKLNADAETLEVDSTPDTLIKNSIVELTDRKALSDCMPFILSRRRGLIEIIKYSKCVADLGTTAISRLATTLRTALVTPELKQQISDEISELGIGHIPLKFTEQSLSGKSFFEIALDSTNARKKKKHVLSEGEQRALAIACFLADPHVKNGRGALIIDDPVTSLDHHRIRRVANRFAQEAATGRQVIIFTHNLLFYQEMLRACADRTPQVAAISCLIQQTQKNFGRITIDEQPWVAKKIKERIKALTKLLETMPENLPIGSEDLRINAKQFYTDLRETWERAVEEIVLGGVVERFGTDVKTQSLKQVDVSDDDYRIIFFAMKRCSERSGHDQAQSRQIDPPSKKQMQIELNELIEFISNHRRKSKSSEERRKDLEKAPPSKTIN